MLMLKLLFQKLQIGPTWLLGKQPTSWGTAKDDRLGTWGGTLAFVFQGETDCSFFHLILPESQSPHPTLCIPCYKKSGLEREEKMVC